MDKLAFQSKFGAVFEHSAWVADAVFEMGIDALFTDTEALIHRFETAFLESDLELQLGTLRAHPQLACALADPEELTSDSATEQAGAGLDQCSLAEMEEFRRLNTAYREKFNFPFIIAVRGRDRWQILDHFRRRLENDVPGEFQTALKQVCQIARFRIGDILDV